MTVGEAIFWGAVSLSLIGLYLGTKDRWRWKRIVLWLMGGVVGVGAMWGCGIVAYQWFESRPRPIIEIWGLSLGMPAAEVLVLKGKPAEKTGDNWMYRDTDRSAVQVEFESGAVSAVFVTGERVSWPRVGNLNTYLTLSEFTNKYGEPTFSRTSTDGLFRTLTYNHYNLTVAFGKGEMVSAGMLAKADKGRAYGNANTETESK